MTLHTDQHYVHKLNYMGQPFKSQSSIIKVCKYILMCKPTGEISKFLPKQVNWYLISQKCVQN